VPAALAARIPNLNAYAERWVRSTKEECLAKLILFGERSLQGVVSNYLEHNHQERNHQGKDNRLLFPVAAEAASARGAIRYRSGSAAYSNITAAPHEYFYYTGSRSRLANPATAP
jgi:hypothetical protein